MALPKYSFSVETNDFKEVPTISSTNFTLDKYGPGVIKGLIEVLSPFDKNKFNGEIITSLHITRLESEDTKKGTN